MRLFFLILVLAVSSSLLAQQAETNKETLPEIKAKAEAGDAKAQYALGLEADDLAQMAAHANTVSREIYPKADVPVPNAQEYGVQAYKWFCLAAAHTNFSLATDARRRLAGNLLFMTPEEIERAKELVRKIEPDAVAKVEADIAADERKEFETDKSGAENGNPEDQWNLGCDYNSGRGVLADSVQAAKWFRRSAMQGNCSGEDFLGRMYESGTGVPQDYVEAYKWFNLAAAQDEPTAQGSRDFVARKMTPDQIAEAQRLSTAFVPHKEMAGSSTDQPVLTGKPAATATGFFITEEGYLISNYHVVKDAAQVRLVTSAGTIPAKVVQVDAANDLALLKADGRFAPLPIISSRSMKLGGTVATVGFPDPGLQGFAPKVLAHGHHGGNRQVGSRTSTARYFQISTPVQPGKVGVQALAWQRSGRHAEA